MQWHEFIFSEERKHKIVRHLVFWVAWWLYFLLFYFLLQQPLPYVKMKSGHLMMDHHLLIKTLLLLTLYAVACYALIYYLLPQFINRKWLKASAGSMLLFSFLLISSHLLYWNIFPFIDSSFNSVKPTRAVAWFWPAINLGLLNFAKIAAAAAIIKYIKYWWLKEKESQRLEREKINADLQLLKAQVHPDFLFKTLNNIYAHAQSSSPRTSGMLLKLSDLLSYMLYECDQQTVPLEKEIQMMKEYMQLEKIRHDDEPEIQVNIKGDLNGKSIAPFLLLPFIENSFKHCGQMTEQFWINMDIRIEEDNFSMKLTNGISEKMNDQELLNTDGLTNVQKRLTLLYPNDHELRITTEQEMSIVLLDIVLKDVTDIAFDEEEDDEPLNGRTNIIHALKYATD